MIQLRTGPEKKKRVIMSIHPVLGETHDYRNCDL